MNIKVGEDDLLNLNITLPIILIIILLIANLEYFAIVYIESISELIKIYLFFSFLVLFIDLIRVKIYKKSLINLNIYKVGVLSSLLVLVFIVSNSFYSETIFETQIRYNKDYEVNLRKYIIPREFEFLYKIKHHEEKEFLYKNKLLDIKVGETLFKYKIIKKREFITYN